MGFKGNCVADCVGIHKNIPYIKRVYQCILILKLHSLSGMSRVAGFFIDDLIAGYPFAPTDGLVPTTLPGSAG